METLDLFYIQLILREDYLEFKWNSNTEKMTADKYKEILLQYAEFVEKHKPKKMLLDTIQNKFLITPEIQEWSNKEIFPRSFKAGMSKIATLLPEDFVTQVSQEQLFDEEESKKKANQYFSDKDEAIKWLLED